MGIKWVCQSSSGPQENIWFASEELENIWFYVGNAAGGDACAHPGSCSLRSTGSGHVWALDSGAVTTLCAQPVYAWQVTPHTELSSHYRVVTASLDQCKSMCQMQIGCTAFSFDASSTQKQCRLPLKQTSCVKHPNKQGKCVQSPSHAPHNKSILYQPSLSNILFPETCVSINEDKPRDPCMSLFWVNSHRSLSWGNRQCYDVNINDDLSGYAAAGFPERGSKFCSGVKRLQPGNERHLHSKCDLTICTLQDTIVVEHGDKHLAGSPYRLYSVKIRKITMCKRPVASSEMVSLAHEECRVEKSCAMVQLEECEVQRYHHGSRDKRGRVSYRWQTRVTNCKAVPLGANTTKQSYDAARKVCMSE